MKNKNNLKSKIITWFNEQGYPLEMRIAETLHQRAFRVFQSQYYLDPESGDYRELDVVAFREKLIDDVSFRVSLSIECKRSTDKPWLLFTSYKTGLAKPACVCQRAANSVGRYYLIDVCHENELQELPIFSLPERAAYGVTQAFTTGKDVCYSAVTSVAKAALASVTELDERIKRKKKKLTIKRYPEICSIVLPVVVVEGQLFEIFLNSQSGLEIKSIENGTLLWRNPIFGAPNTILNIVTSSGFDQFADNAVTSIDNLIDLSEKQFSRSIKRATERAKRFPTKGL